MNLKHRTLIASTCAAMLFSQASMTAQETSDQPTGHDATPAGIQMCDPASVDISLLQEEFKSIINAILMGKTALTIDWAQIDNAIVDWFDSKKDKPDWRDVLKIAEKKNALIEATKMKARERVKFLVNSWNTTVDNANSILQTSLNVMKVTLPYGKITGNYCYIEGTREPGVPGWNLNKNISLFNFPNMAGNFGTGLVEIEIEASGDLSFLGTGVAANAITKVSADLKLGFNANCTLSEPMPASARNRPVAATGFFAEVPYNVNFSQSVAVLIKLDASLSVSKKLDLGAYSKNIEAKKFKKVTDP